jgi:hypothetical protein
MEPLKLPLEKVFFFIAGVIPGFVALLIFQLAVPNAFSWFFVLGFLGYKTKLYIVLLTSLLVGYSITTFLNVMLGAVGGVIGSRMVKGPYKSPHTYETGPWRDIRWRVALRARLGNQTPNDTTLVPEAVFNIRRQTIDFMPENERPKAINDLTLEKLKAEMDDNQWAQWYDHYHYRVLLSRDKWDVQGHVAHGLNFNLESAAVYTLASTPLVPSLRHWWCILPAFTWILLLALEQYGSVRRLKDPWTTLTQQIEYLSAESSGESAAEKKTKD